MRGLRFEDLGNDSRFEGKSSLERVVYTESSSQCVRKSDLTGADLNYTDLRRTLLSEDVLRAALFCGADLRGATISGGDES